MKHCRQSDEKLCSDRSIRHTNRNCSKHFSETPEKMDFDKYIPKAANMQEAGPCSTGKKETIKDLAKILGVRCLIVNCVKSMGYSSIENLFQTLFECKMWACFDHFDEIDPSVLSIISPLITSGIKLEKQKRFSTDVKLNLISSSPNMFIILKSGSGNKIPESIIASFRSFAFMVPDSELICELMLLCEGFRHPKTLSRKMCALNRLIRNQFSIKETPLSLRVLRRIISSSGRLLRETDENTELIIIMKALRDCFEPLLLPDDIPILNGLINDVFPGIYLNANSNSPTKEIICSLMNEKLYSITETQVEKVIQLRASKLVQRASIVVGSTCSGKSVVIKTCTEIDVKYGHFVSNYVLSPKAYSYTDLFGFVNKLTKEWNDGTVTSICRKLNSKSYSSSNNSIDKINIIFDGQIDSSWIENVSSLMDESRTLTLANCNRIELDHDYFIIFETGSLALASPVIISRALLVYVDSNTTNYAMFWSRWLKKRVNENEIQCLSIMFDAFVHPLVISSWNRLENTNCVHRNQMNLIQQLCHVLEALLPVVEEEYSAVDRKPSTEKAYSEQVKCIFIEALYWSLGSSLDSNSRDKFDGLVKDLWLKMNSTDKHGELPNARPTMYHYTYSRKESRWVDWGTRLEPYVHECSSHFSEMIVPTEDNVKNEWILDVMTRHNCENVAYSTYEYRTKAHSKTRRPILFVGETGSLKTTLIAGYLNKLNTDLHTLRRVHCTKNTTSLELQNIIESCIENQGRNTYGPSHGKKLIVFLDDLHSPKSDCYGSVELLEFIRLLAGKQGFYEREGKKEWRKVINTYIYAALTFASGKQLEIDPRLSSQFSIFTMNLPSAGTAQTIFASILNGHFKDFSIEIRDSIQGVATLTIEFIEKISRKLLASPSKFYYEFNVRSLSQIVKSLLHASKELYSSKTHILRLLRNEILRTVSDRILDSQDKMFVTDALNNSIREHFPESNEHVWSEPILFGDFRNAMIGHIPRLYEDLLDYNAVFHLFTEISVKFKENGKVGLVLFVDALEHLIRIHRILRQSEGHAIIFGPAGTGKRSLIELASFGAGCNTYRLQLNNNDTITTFANKMRVTLKKSAELENGLTFLLASEFDINEDILEAIFNLICRGLVPSSCIMEPIVETNENSCKKISSDFRYQEDVVTLCRNKLHIVLSLSIEEQQTLRGYCSFFPGLMSKVYIDWVLPWSSEAYHTIANEHLKDVDFIEDQFKSEIMEIMCYIHENMFKFSEVYFKTTKQKNYVNPDHFLTYIREFTESIQVQASSIISKVNRYTEGIEKIKLLENQLLTLGTMLDNQKEKVKLKSDEIIQITMDLNTVTEEFEEKQEILKEKGQEITNQRKKLLQLQANLEKMLKVASPISASAKEIVESLDQDSVSEISLMPIVPEPVQVVCECIAVLKGAEDINWPNAKSLFEDPFLLAKLKDMDYNSIGLFAQQLVKSHLKTSKRLSEMKDISLAGLGLLNFVESVLDYCTLYRDIRPKQEKLRCLEEELMKLTSSLETTTTEIEDNKVLIRSLKNRQNEFVEGQSSLQLIVDEMQEKYDLVSDLIDRLKRKKETWEEEKRALQLKETHLLGNQLIETAFINYTSFFNPIYRAEIVYMDWLEKIKSTSVPISNEFRVENMIRQETRNLWATQGFKLDGSLMQNCIFLELSSKIPIFIDPQKQACRWIVEKESTVDLVQVHAYDDNIFDTVLEAMTTGKSLLVKNYEEYNETIQSVLENKGKDGVYTIRGQTINADEKFRIYIAVSIGAKLCPETFVKGCVINFDMTCEALEDHLTGWASLIKNPVSENQRRNLLTEKHNNSLELFEYDSRVLTDLAIIIEGQTDVFHGYESVSSLNELTLLESRVQQQLNKCIQQIESSDAIRNQYRSIARKGTVLFRSLSRMNLVNYIYQFSLDSFEKIFKSALYKTSDNNQESMAQQLLRLTFSSGCKGIFEQDKLIFTLDLILSLEFLDLKVTKEKMIFLLGDDEYEQEIIHALETFTWITLEGKKLLKKLVDELPTEFSELPKELADNEHDWKKWVEQDNCDIMAIPKSYSNCSKFDWLLLVKCFRKDILFQAIVEYTRSVVGEDFLILQNNSLDEIVSTGEPNTPTIFFLTPNSETEDLLSLLEHSSGKNGMIKIGVGNDIQSTVDKVEQASFKGLHILLTNVHLSPALLKRIDQMIEKSDSFEEEFRLWVTCKPSQNVPISFLMRSQKVVYQSSPILKLNLMNTYLRMPEDQLNSCSHPAFKTVVFSLAFLHAVILERKQIDNTGWAIDSVSSQRNFTVSLEYLLHEMTTNPSNQDDQISWTAIKYFIREISLGGCLRTVQDYQVLGTFTDEYFGDFLFDSKQQFSFDRQNKALEYAAPNLDSRQDYLDYIGNLPLFTPASAVGLSKHSEVERSLHSLNYFKNTMIILQNISVKDKETHRDENTEVAQIIDQILSTVPSEALTFNYSTPGKEIKPFDVFLHRDLTAFNFFTNKICKELNMLKEVLFDGKPTSPTLHNILNSLKARELPYEWRSFPPYCFTHLGEWTVHLKKRIAHYYQWITRGEPWIIWMSGLCKPEAYMICLAQTESKRKCVPLDEITFYAEITTFEEKKQIPCKPDQGCFVEGLILERVKWDRHSRSLCDSLQYGLVDPLPIVKVIPLQLVKKMQSKTELNLPVYTSERNKTEDRKLFELSVFVGRDINYWRVRNTSIVLSKQSETLFT